jgi:hypothetical protein
MFINITVLICKGLIPCSKLRGRSFFLNQIMQIKNNLQKANPAIGEKPPPPVWSRPC